MLDEVTAIPDLPAMDLPITNEPRTSFTLPSAYYTSPEVFEREKESIFYRTWQYVAHRSAFADPGDYVTLRICDQYVFVITEAMASCGPSTTYAATAGTSS